MQIFIVLWKLLSKTLEKVIPTWYLFSHSAFLKRMSFSGQIKILSRRETSLVVLSRLLNQRAKRKAGVIFRAISRVAVFSSLFCLLIAPRIFALQIPNELGFVSNESKGQNGKTIVLIQDAHVHYQAQKAIAEILKTLIEKESLRLILIEGGWNDMSVSSLRNYADQKARLEVAERYLKAGKISGTEYLDIASDFPISVWGIEDQDLYANNMNAFLKINEHQADLLHKLDQFGLAVDALKGYVFSPRLQSIEEKRTAFANGKLNLLSYLPFLGNEAGSAEIESLPHLKRLFSLMGGGQEFDAQKAELEKHALIQALSKI